MRRGCVGLVVNGLLVSAWGPGGEVAVFSSVGASSRLAMSAAVACGAGSAAFAAALRGSWSALGLVGLGVYLRMSNWSKKPMPVGLTRRWDFTPRHLLLAGLAAVAAFILSGLVVMGVFTGLAGLVLPRLFFDPRANRKIARLEGLASWMEQLRDTMASGAGLQQVILVTSRSAPAPVAAEIRRLALDLQNRVTVRTALLRLADALEDETGDLLVAGLMQAADLSGARLSELLTLLASSAREEVAMRQRVDASQTRARNEAKTVVGLSGAMFLGLATFGRAYMAPYHTLQGTMVLTVVAAIYMSGVWLFTRLATPVTAPRLLADAHDLEPST